MKRNRVEGKTKFSTVLPVRWPDPNNLRPIRVVGNSDELEKIYKQMTTELVFRLASNYTRFTEQEFYRRLKRIDQWYEYKIYTRSMDLTALRLSNGIAES